MLMYAFFPFATRVFDGKNRANDDGTFDSICPCCFRTVGSAMEQSQLGEFERNHICEDRFIPPDRPR
jgi:hypothetical protein